MDVLPPLPNWHVSELVASPPSPIVGTSTELIAPGRERGDRAVARFDAALFSARCRPSGSCSGAFGVPPLDVGESAEVQLIWDTTGLEGAHTIHALVDPDGGVLERNENDNGASLAIDVRPPPPAQPDLEIAAFTLEPSTLERLPEIVVAALRIVNTGLDPVPVARVEIYQGNPDLGGVLIDETTTAVAGDSGVDVTFELDVTTGGTRTYFVRVRRHDDGRARPDQQRRIGRAPRSHGSRRCRSR